MAGIAVRCWVLLLSFFFCFMGLPRAARPPRKAADLKFVTACP